MDGPKYIITFAVFLYLISLFSLLREGSVFRGARDFAGGLTEHSSSEAGFETEEDAEYEVLAEREKKNVWDLLKKKNNSNKTYPISNTVLKYTSSETGRFSRPDDHYESFLKAKTDALLPPWFQDPNQSTVLVLSCSWGYVSALVNFFMFQPDLFRLMHVAIVCLDKRFADWYESHGGRCAQRIFGQDVDDLSNLHKKWKTRSRTVHGFLERGVNVIASDSDALWVGNPLWYLDGKNVADIIISRAIFPFSVRNRFGATGCMGLSFFKATPAVAKYYKEFVVASLDDQAGFNLQLLRASRDIGPTAFELGSGKRMSNDKHSTGISYARYNRSGIVFSVGFLPAVVANRKCFKMNMDHPALAVAHCHSAKTGIRKVKSEIARGLYFLPDRPIDWMVEPDQHVKYEDGMDFVHWILDVANRINV